MHALLRISAAIDAVTERIGSWVGWLLLASVLISAGNAIVRYLFNMSSNGWLEIQWYLFAAAFMLAAADTLRANEHVRVDLIYNHVSARARLWIDLVGTIVFLLPATILLGWLSWPVFVDAWLSNEQSGNAGGLVRWPVKLMLPLGFFLLTVQGISELMKRVAALHGDIALKTEYEAPLQ